MITKLELTYIVCKEDIYDIVDNVMNESTPELLEKNSVYTTEWEDCGFYLVGEFKNEVWIHKDEFHVIPYYVIEDAWNKIKILFDK